jgi:hypothetical protein
MRYRDIVSEPKVMSQQTIGEQDGDIVDKLTVKTEARTKIRAKTKVRRHLRLEDPVVKNILNPSVKDVSETEQSRLVEFFPGDVDTKEYLIEVIIIR